MRVHTTYFPMEELWGWSIWEGDTFIHICHDLYALKSNAHQAGIEWIIEANKLLDTINGPEGYNALMLPGPVFHWVPLVWVCWYEYRWHPAITDCFGNLVHLNSTKAATYIGWREDDLGL